MGQFILLTINIQIIIIINQLLTPNFEFVLLFQESLCFIGIEQKRDSKNMNKKLLSSALKLAVIPLLIALTACGSILAFGGLGNSQRQPTPIIPVTGGNPSVTVDDQATDGTSVLVADAFSQGPGWMVIHSQVNGTVGPAIGETHLNPGDNKNILVKIDPAQATSVMYAMLHIDAGTLGTYEFPGPDVPVMFNGNMLSPAFNATIHAAAANTPTPAASVMAMDTPSAGGTNLLVKVSDQPLVGNTVMVDDVVSSGPGWIVIYSTDGYGQPAQPIGHAAVKDGDNPMVMVTVDPMSAQGTLFAQLHVDKGTVGTFEFPGPDAPVMLGAKMIGSAFKITSGQTAAATTVPGALQPSITVSDQVIQNGTVTIAQIVSNGNWWLVIHKQNSDGTMGEYIGETLIKNGINTNVVVKINMSLATPVLYAMLHEDHGVIGVLEFPGPDVPVMVNGQMVAPTFNVTGLVQDVTINIKKASGSVSYLTDAQGNSLYLSLNDTPGTSNCSPTCLTLWKPLLVNKRVIPGPGVLQVNLGVILLQSGARQVTYKGAPLYFYYKDMNPGDTNGQGIGGVWFLVTP
jgi:predicted lipoprotein with Yx(FWY)xxD motif